MKINGQIVCSAINICRDCGKATDAYGSRCEYCGSKDF